MVLGTVPESKDLYMYTQVRQWRKKAFLGGDILGRDLDTLRISFLFFFFVTIY
jgi:hypothetical protein